MSEIDGQTGVEACSQEKSPATSVTQAKAEGESQLQNGQQSKACQVSYADAGEARVERDCLSPADSHIVHSSQEMGSAEASPIQQPTCIQELEPKRLQRFIKCITSRRGRILPSKNTVI